MRVEDAIKNYRDAIKTEARWLPPYLRLAQILIQNHHENEALDVSNAMVSRNELIEEEPALPIDWKSVVQSAEKLTASQPDEPLSHAFLGLCQLKKGFEEND